MLILIPVVAIATVVLIQFVFVSASESVDTRPQGAFYVAPASIPTGHPGAILRSQPHTVPKAMGAPAGTTATSVLYSSTDYATGKPIAVSGVVYQPPPSPTPRGGRPVIAWAHGTVGVAAPCAPSLLANPPQRMQPGFASFLQAGWVVTTTDYTGLGTQGPNPYLIGASSGREVLDSVRAAQRLPGTGAGNKVIIWGHSQGGHSALFAGDLAKSYAPELKVQGVAVAAPAAELAELMRLDAGSVSGVVFSSFALWSWSHTVPGADLSAVVSSSGRDLIDAIASRCISSNLSLVEDLPAAIEAQKTGVINAARLQANPTWAAIEAENTPPLSGKGPPMFVAQGTADTVIRPVTTAQVVATLCKRGRDVQSLLMPGVQHPTAGQVAAPSMFAWAKVLLAGGHPAGNCPT